ncbi:uncharacterized protein LTR77_006969 [Saxophila tyrrhenica]|uniref:2',3'-cyclic-nucleotide 3'-phosphodiesterase n=1 Tax=Saxophila tyrrhenica TaxID=1690608 RepID=A0AAV9P717_9PEZI|nr:hypothetical protein LTR77_006969 [Saxophila tyrrhenica]
MPMSLWLIPHSGNPFTKAFQELISDTIPRNFSQKSHIVSPHVELTSDIDLEKAASGKSPQEWLDGLQLPDFKAEFNEVVVTLDEVEADDAVERKMSISVKEDGNLQGLAAVCRRDGTSASEEEAQAWAKKEFKPYFGLLHADVPTDEVKKKIPLVEMKIGFAIGDIFACCGGTLCMGGYLVLVDMSKPVDEWETVAKRETPWVMWRATHNLI